MSHILNEQVPLRNSSRFSDEDLEAQRRMDRAAMSRVKVVGYVPDLEPLDPHHPVKPLQRINTPQYGSLPSPDPTASSSSPLLTWISTDGLKSGVEKYFREGSVRGSVFNLCSATLGAGALSLPYAFAKSGLALGLLLLLVGALATAFTIHLLILARVRTNLTSYEDMSVTLFGRLMGTIVEVNIILFCYGTTVAYCRAIGDILEPVVPLLHLPHFFNGNTALIFFWLFVMFPLSMVRKMNSLRFSSLFGVTTIIFLVVATTVHCITHTNFAHDVKWADARYWFAGSAIDVIEAAPIVIFAFSCQVNVFAIYDELEHRSERKMARVTNAAMFVCLAVYITMGFFGFTEFQQKTCGNILQNYKDDVKHSGLIICAYIAISLTIIMAFPMSIFPCRYTVEVMLKSHLRAGSWLTTDSNLRHFFLTVVISGTSLLLSLFVPNISVVFQLIGGTTSAFVCYVMPCAYAIKLRLNHRSRVHTFATWFVAIGGAVVGAISTGVTIYNTATKASSDC